MKDYIKSTISYRMLMDDVRNKDYMGLAIIFFVFGPMFILLSPFLFVGYLFSLAVERFDK